ncbi:unnamed protein product [Phytophthora lilii]|uniref:Unnamed protein product n=1 Tax=Phytophthora lilii TaxID=2077276 RepID=A0A9W6TKX0_9STRA|nr:unnamed protein product [Phytophthora lilii]
MHIHKFSIFVFVVANERWFHPRSGERSNDGEQQRLRSLVSRSVSKFPSPAHLAKTRLPFIRLVNLSQVIPPQIPSVVPVAVLLLAEVTAVYGADMKATTMYVDDVCATTPTNVLVVLDATCTSDTSATACAAEGDHFSEIECTTDTNYAAIVETKFGTAPYLRVETYSGPACAGLDSIKVILADGECHEDSTGSFEVVPCVDGGETSVNTYTDAECQVPGITVTVSNSDLGAISASMISRSTTSGRRGQL